MAPPGIPKITSTPSASRDLTSAPAPVVEIDWLAAFGVAAGPAGATVAAAARLATRWARSCGFGAVISLHLGWLVSGHKKGPCAGLHRGQRTLASRERAQGSTRTDQTVTALTLPHLRASVKFSHPAVRRRDLTHRRGRAPRPACRPDDGSRRAVAALRLHAAQLRLQVLGRHRPSRRSAPCPSRQPASMTTRRRAGSLTPSAITSSPSRWPSRTTTSTTGRPAARRPRHRRRRPGRGRS